MKTIEEKYGVKILFLIESGSRAWGWASEDSDFDMRGVYIQDYNQLEYRSQINLKHQDKDVELWDLKKFLTLMAKSNPSVWEWLSSDIVYIDHPVRKNLQKMFKKSYSRFALQKHYSSMARDNFNKYINLIGDKANLKKYLYVLRSIACILWIKKYNSPPPKNYLKVIEMLPKYCQTFFKQIICMKKKSEKIEGPRNKEVERFIIPFWTKKYKEDKSKFSIKKLNQILKDEKIHS